MLSHTDDMRPVDDLPQWRRSPGEQPAVARAAVNA